MGGNLVAKGGISGPGPPCGKVGTPCENYANFLRGSNFAHGALETEEIWTELKKLPAFVLIIAQYNSQSDSDYMYVSVIMKENEY